MHNFKLKVIVTGACGFIGINLCLHLIESGYYVIAIDRRPGHADLQCDEFYRFDLNDYQETEALLRRVKPDWLVHLAARTDLDGKDIESYVDNIVPTWNLLHGLLRNSSHTRIVVFSSMLEDVSRGSVAYFYGLSKRRAEEICAGFAMNLKITVVRPPGVWGPYFQQPYRTFFLAVLAGHFVHCSIFDGLKTFAYVGNLVAQTEAVMLHQDKLPSSIYLGDVPPISANYFANEIAVQRNVRINTAPSILIWTAAFFGSALSVVGIRFPITLFRLSNMRKGRVVDVSPIVNMAAKPIDFPTAVRKTIAWLGK
jgi:nucleoside-diphosphate-sugar epimerase